MNRTHNLKGGVLMIGSLFWDNGLRNKWRLEHLSMQEAAHVFAPIRYGRLSSSRKCTYTMILLQTCSAEKQGAAILAPFRKPIISCNDIRDQAQALWQAEGGLAGRISGSWGSVGLLVNPAAAFPAQFKEEWGALHTNQRTKPSFPDQHDNTSVLGANGQLLLDWLRISPTGEPVDLDFILATVTVPEITLPSAQTIAERMRGSGYREYFDRNRDAGIKTFQDDEILRHLE